MRAHPVRLRSAIPHRRLATVFFFSPGTRDDTGRGDPRPARSAEDHAGEKHGPASRCGAFFFFFRAASADAPDDTPPKVPRTPTTCGDMGEYQMGTPHIRHLRGDTIHDAIAKLQAVQLSNDWERTCVRRGDAERISRYKLRDGMRYRRPTWHELDDRGRTARGPLRPRKAPHAARRRGASPRDATRERAAGTRAMRAG